MKTSTPTITNNMKKQLVVLSMAAIFAACGTKQSPTDANLVKGTTDTAGLYRDENRVMNLDGVGDTTTTTITTTTVTKSVNGQPVSEVSDQKPIAKRPVAARRPARSTSTNKSVGSSSGNGTSTQPTAQVAKKKGWSKAAKGTAIGAGSGAVLGAVISKKKGKGAIIGGVLGAGVGYGVGRAQDKKDGRVQ